MSRKEARETVFKLVYEMSITGGKNPFSFDIYTENFNDDEMDYAKKVYGGVAEKMDFITRIIERYSKAFKIDRVYKTDLAALLVAAYEILFCPEIPYQVATNEAVEISKRYSTEKSYKFINGILSSVIKERVELLKEHGGE